MHNTLHKLSRLIFAEIIPKSFSSYFINLNKLIEMDKKKTGKTDAKTKKEKVQDERARKRKIFYEIRRNF